MKRVLRNGLTSLLAVGVVMFGPSSLDGYLNGYQCQSGAIYI